MGNKLCIIIPAYNEEKRIGKTLNEYCLFFKERGIDFGILVVLNACKDNTIEIVKNYQKKFKEIDFIELEKGGKGLAIIGGFKKALTRDNKLIGFVDADMATPPNAFLDLYNNIKNFDGIIASRSLKNSKVNFTIIRKITHKGFNFLVRGLFLFPYKDTQCGAKLFKKNVIDKIINSLRLTQWAFDINLLYLCKKNYLKIKEYPTIWEDKKDSKITNLLRTTLQMFLGVVRLRLIYSPLSNILKPIKFILKWGDKLINKK